MKKLTITLLIFFITIYSFAQTVGIKWTKYITPSFATSELVFESQQTDDGGYILAGIDTAFDYDRNTVIYNKYTEGRAWLAKLDGNGVLTWTRYSPTVDPHSGGFLSICRMPSGLNVAAGHGNTTSALPSNFYIAAYNDVGNFQWDNLYGGSNIDRAYNIQTTSDGGFILAGFTLSNDGQVSGNHNPGTADAWIVKLDASRAIQWQKCYGGAGGDTAYSILQTSDGYIVAGVSSSSNGDLTGNNGLSDAWIFKIDNTGNIQWQRNIGGVENDALKSIVSNSDNSYTLTGYTRSATVLNNGLKGQADLWIITVSGTDGSTIWSKGYGGTSNDHGYSIKRTVGNGFIVGGYTESTNGDISSQAGRADGWLLNLQNDGSLNWQKTVGTAKDEFVLTVLGSDNGDFTITGYATPVTPMSFFDSTDGYAVRLGSFNTIKGILFYDVNSNGIKDIGEGNFTLATVKAVNGSYQKIAIPSDEGFSMKVDLLGTYSTSVVFNSPYYIAVPASHPSTFTTYLNTDSFSFAVQPLPAIKDLVINAIPLSPARPGFSVKYQIIYKNVGTAISSGEVHFKRDPRLNFVSAVPPVSSVNADTLKWSYTNLQPLEVRSITVNMTVSTPPTVNIGDTLTSIGIITPVAGDQTPNDDTVLLKQIVVGSYDPNDKYEKNEGRVPPEYVADGKYLDYLVRFQNLGTDTAFNIIVLDTLSEKLDLSSLQVITSSHSYKLTLTGNILTWTFNDILLPHSAINEPASHGYIAYRIKPLNSVALGDTIHNSASIYFDFNLPVQTNNAFTVVQDNVALGLDLLSFTGVYRAEKTTLQWTTTNEVNIERFELQRSFTGTDFATIGQVMPHGRIGTVAQYEFIDVLNNISANTFFYRLLIREKDGKISYSKILLFKRVAGAGNSISINPNPVTGISVVNVNYTSQAWAEFRVVDMNGKIVLKQRNTILQGNNSINIAGMEKLGPGFYLLQALIKDHKLTAPFIIK